MDTQRLLDKGESTLPVRVFRLPPANVSNSHPFHRFLVRMMPICLAISWTSTLVILMFTWAVIDGRARYVADMGNLPLLSDVGAEHKAIFVTGCLYTAVFLVLSTLCERYLRSRKEIMSETRHQTLWKCIAVLETILALGGGTSLVLMAWYDNRAHSHAHAVLFTCFISMVTLSCMLQGIEIIVIWREHPHSHDLRDLAWTKAVIFIFANMWGISFVIGHFVCSASPSTSMAAVTFTAAAEWMACFLIAAYYITLCFDVWPAYRHEDLFEVVRAVDVTQR